MGIQSPLSFTYKPCKLERNKIVDLAFEHARYHIELETSAVTSNDVARVRKYT